MRSTMKTISVVALFALAPATARAGQPAEAWNDLVALEGHLGLGTPTGLAGVALDLTPHPRLSFNLGVGAGLVGPQLAAMARVRALFITPNLSLGVGGGTSGGDTGTLHVQDFRELRFAKAIWVNGEVFLELRRGHFHLRPYAGVGRRVRDGGCTFIEEEAKISEPCSLHTSREVNLLDDVRTIAYTGVALGWAF